MEEGQTLVVLEAMKMEYPVASPVAGRVTRILVESSQLTQQGDVLAIVMPEQ